jgi:hypothetical protein
MKRATPRMPRSHWLTGFEDSRMRYRASDLVRREYIIEWNAQHRNVTGFAKQKLETTLVHAETILYFGTAGKLGCANQITGRPFQAARVPALVR